MPRNPTTRIQRACWIVIVACMLALVWLTIPASRQATKAQSRPKFQRGNALSQEQRQRRQQNFKPGRDLLLKKGVPFDPDELLDPNWQRKLKPRLALMPEMQETRVVWERQIRGVFS